MPSLTNTSKRACGSEVGASDVSWKSQFAKGRGPVYLIGAASGLGSPQPGCAAGPDTLHRCEIDRALAQRGINASWRATVRPPAIKEISTSSSPISMFCNKLSEQVTSLLQSNSRFVVIGGDHSCAIGTWSGVAAAIRTRGPLGLIWIDAHMDSHTPESSPSGALHGMPLACLLGYGDAHLTNINYPGAKLLPQHICLVAVRSYEASEAALLNRLGIRVILMDEINRRGLAVALNEALEIASGGTAGFGISIDLDAIDPIDAPGVGTPEPGGLDGLELVESLVVVAHHEELIGLEIAEFNPLLDREHKTARLVEDFVCAALGNSRDAQHASSH